MDGCEGKPCESQCSYMQSSVCLCLLSTCFNPIGVGSNKYKSNIFSTSCSSYMFSADLSSCIFQLNTFSFSDDFVLLVNCPLALYSLEEGIFKACLRSYQNLPRERKPAAIQWESWCSVWCKLVFGPTGVWKWQVALSLLEFITWYPTDQGCCISLWTLPC